MNVEDAKRLQGQVFALQAFLDSMTRTLAKTNPQLFEAVVRDAQPVVDDVRKSWAGADPMVTSFIETFERLLGKQGASVSPPVKLSVVKGDRN